MNCFLVTLEAELDANDLTNQILDTKTAVQELLHIARETDSKYTTGMENNYNYTSL